MSTPQPSNPPRIRWYRSPVSREELARLTQRSDWLGFLQTGGFLGWLTLTAAAVLYSAVHWPWYATVALAYVHGMGCAFLVNAHHELVHESVFRTNWLNKFFLRVLSFLGWLNPHQFWASHTEHHKFTLHPPDDLEVVLPQRLTSAEFLRLLLLDPMWPYHMVYGNVEIALGRVKGDWNNQLFPPDNVVGRRRYRNWARLLLVGHGLIFVGSLSLGWWMLPVVVSLPKMWGSWLQTLCNTSQHIGLRDNVPDIRLCCRTIRLNPFLQFLYWHMNYHTEHHMYAAVPCYRLGRLHRLIKQDLPECPNGLWQTWKQIRAIQKRQLVEPTYQFEPVLPTKAT